LTTASAGRAAKQDGAAHTSAVVPDDVVAPVADGELEVDNR
jgi:hypothetical protein